MASRPRFAIVGAGPAGAFAAAAILRARGDAEVDFFERLPTPVGAAARRRGARPPGDQAPAGHLRAPDAQARLPLHRQRRGRRGRPALRAGRALLGGRLRDRRADRQVARDPGRGPARAAGRPPSSSPGTTATPTSATARSTSPRARAVVIGNGNVAADVIRVLTRDPDELARTDIADHALEALRASRDRGGRRARPPRARAGRLHERRAARARAARRRRPARGSRRRRARPRLGASGSRRRAPSRRARTSSCCATSRRRARAGSHSGAPRRIELRFLTSPVEIRGDGRVEAVDVRRNELVARRRRLAARPRGRRRRSRRSRPASCCAPSATAPCRFPTCRSTSAPSCCPTSAGRALTPDGEPLPGVYAVGWIKRGPTGILGTNKRDAEETIACLAEDLRAGRLREPPRGRARADRRAAGRARARRGHAPTAGTRSTRSSASAAAAPSARA